MGAAFSAFEVEGLCGAMDEKLNCGVKTTVNGTSRKQIAETLGGLTRGNIETNGDLAGIGVSNFGKIQIPTADYIRHFLHSLYLLPFRWRWES